MGKLIVNFRFKSSQHSRGVTRYCENILDKCEKANIQYECIMPKKKLNVVRSHLWEQVILPTKLKNDLLWSPVNTGPVRYLNQVVTVHDILPIDMPNLYAHSFFSYEYFKWVLEHLLRNVKKIITVSNYTKERIMERLLIPDKKISVCNNAICPLVPATPESIRYVREKYHIDRERYVLSVASLDIKKNLAALVKAWNILKDSIKKDINLVLVGQQHNQLSLKHLCLDDIPDGVVITGFVPDEDLPALYKGASAFVFPSLYEGFGLPPIEAMSCGTPVVVSNVTSLPEVCGDAAVYVDPLDIESIANGILKILEDTSLVEDLRSKGFKRVALFSWDACAKKHLEVFSNLMI